MYTKALITLFLASTAFAHPRNEWSNSNSNYNYNNGNNNQNLEASSVTSVQRMVETVTATATASASCSSSAEAGKIRAGLSQQSVQVVQVSDNNGTLRYFPESVQAQPGSIVQFQFNPKNHTVTESSFAAPCVPIASNLTSATRPGQRSGFVPVTPTDTDRKVFNMLINDTKPIWIFCGQMPHCQKGMVMVINQNLTETVKTLDNYRAAAMAIPIPGASNSSAPASSSAAGGYGAASSTVATVAATTQASNPTTTAATGTVAGQGSTGTAGVTPAVFTGIATRPEVIVYAGYAGAFVAGIAALL